MLRRVGARLAGRPTLDLPREGGQDADFLPRKIDPNSTAARLRERVEGAGAMLRGTPAVREDLQGAEKVSVKRREDIPSMDVRTDKIMKDKAVSRVVKRLTYELEAEQRFDEFKSASAEYAATHHGEAMLARPLAAVLARGGMCARKDNTAAQAGQIRVNGRVVKDPRHLVLPTDNITFNGFRVLIDYPRIWRVGKGLGDKSFITAHTNRSTDYSRWKIKGLPTFAWPAGQFLPPWAGGLSLMTNDPGLARYINESKDMERDWTLRVQGNVPPEFLRKLNTGYAFQGKTWNLEVVVTEQHHAKKTFHKRARHDRHILATCLAIRSWGATPNLVQLFREVGKQVDAVMRVKVGPYHGQQVPAGAAIEAYIDEHLMQFVDQSWTPWVDMHAPLLQDKVVGRMERYMNTKRSAGRNAKQFAEDLEEIRERAVEETSVRRKDTHVAPLLRVDEHMERTLQEDYVDEQRRKKVGRMPKTAPRPLKEILKDARRKAPITMGMV
eukprot:TRINITY_DN28090_c0_g1_i1.p1 TRINITY_DN28090_c0_g1~~TRINITY_DN28090_c0_g1_i1.p1  ORF type:complete len:497 (+),score=195.31 TRINITY_DN28090_c0_g1_i1:49-1539(+)